MQASFVCDADSVVSTAPNLRKAVCDFAKVTAVGQTFQPEYWSVVTSFRTHEPFHPPVSAEWCGIYAVWAWKLAGIDMEWERSTPNGNNNGPYRPGSTARIPFSTDLTRLAPGDIIVREFNQQQPPQMVNHHMIVIATSLEDAPLQLQVLQGNSGNGNRTQTVVSRAITVRSGNRYYFYSIDSVVSSTAHYP